MVTETHRGAESVQTAERDVRQLGEATESAGSKVSHFGEAFSKAGSVAAEGLRTAAGVAAAAVGTVAAGIGAAATVGVGYNAQMETYATSFEVMTGSAQKATEIVAELQKQGAATPFDMPQLAETTKLLMNYGMTADDAMKKMSMLGDISQGNADKMTSISTAYGQMSSAGKVQLEDVKQMIEAGFNPLQEISQTTGESMSSLYARISAGTVSVDEITKSMERSTSAGGKYYQSMEKQSQTFTGLVSTLEDNAKQLSGDIFKGISDSLTSKALPEAIDEIGKLQEALDKGGSTAFVDELGKAFGDLSSQIASAAPAVVDSAVQITQSLLTGFQQNLPQIASSAVEIVSSLGAGIVNTLPQMITIGTELVRIRDSLHAVRKAKTSSGSLGSISSRM